MKKRSCGLGDVVVTVLLLAMGGVLLYGNLFNPEVGRRIGDALKMPLVGAGTGAVLLLSVVLRWLGGCRRPKDAFIEFRSDDGSVGISTRAIKDFIERVGKEFAAVRSIETTLVQGKEGLDIAMDVKVNAGSKIPELSQVLRRRVRESVRESLGIEEIHDIALRVQEIVGEPVKHAEEADGADR